MESTSALYTSRAESKPLRPAGQLIRFPQIKDGIKDGGNIDERPQHLSKFGKASEKYTLHAKPKRWQDHIPGELAVHAESDRDDLPGEPKTKRNWRLQQTGKLFKKPKPWYRTKRCKIIAAVVCVIATALTIWGSIELDRYLKSRNNMKPAVATQKKPAETSIVTKSVPRKSVPTKSSVSTPVIEDCQETGCDTNHHCLITGECVCVEGFAGDDCENNINECEDQASICPSNSDCIDTIGSYTCKERPQKQAPTEVTVLKKKANSLATIVAIIIIVSLSAVMIVVIGAMYKNRRSAQSQTVSYT